MKFLCRAGGAADHLQAGDGLVFRGGWEKPRPRIGATQGGRVGPAAQRGHGLVASHLQAVHGSWKHLRCQWEAGLADRRRGTGAGRQNLVSCGPARLWAGHLLRELSPWG